jgi:hypothetical protein
MSNTLITSIEESCNNCIRCSDLFAIKIYLENGLINSTMLNNIMQHSIDTYADFQIIKLLIDYGATIPSDIQHVIKLPDELFMEVINDIQFKTDLKLIQLCIESKNFSKTKWDTLCIGFVFDQLNDRQIYSLMIYAYKFNNDLAFCYLIDFIKHNKQLLFLFLLYASASSYWSNKYYDYLTELLKPNQNQLVLCAIHSICRCGSMPIHWDNNIKQITNKIRSHKQIKAFEYAIDKFKYNFNGTDEEFIMVDKWLEIINEVINESVNDLI